MITKIYLLFSIGPVQEFIAAGRKTRDLFSGSLMLSYLSAKAIETIYHQSGKNGYKAELILPSIKDFSKINYSSVPNRFLYVIPDYTFDKINEIAKYAQDVIQDEFDKIIQHAKNKFTGIDKDDYMWNAYWEEQKNNFLEIYWAALESEEDYSSIHSTLENLMGKRKVLRNFSELKYGNNEKGQPGLKCSLIQNLSAVHPEKEKPNDFWKEVLKKYPAMVGDLVGKEPLSAIGLAKRFFISYLNKSLDENEISEIYPSTTTIAASTFNNALIEYNKTQDTNNRIDTKKYVDAVRALQNSIEKKLARTNVANLSLLVSRADEQIEKYLNIESDYLLEETYSEKRIQKDYQLSREKMTMVKDKISEAKKVAHDFADEVKKKTGKSISKYYAVVYFDGDNMGKKFDGGDANKISDNLRRFATREAGSDYNLKNVYQIVEDEHLGKVVYSGGDDVLAFTSLEDCMKTAFEIRKNFSGFMGADYSGSAGIAISHHQTDLRHVLNAARKAEEYSKDYLNRDSFAVALLKRSGNSIITGAKWYSDNERINDNVTTLTSFADYIRNKTISTSFVFDLINEIDGLSAFEDNSEAVLSEIKRLLLSHSDKNDREKIKDFHEHQLSYLYKSIKEQYKQKGDYPIKQLCGILEASQFIGQGGER